MSATAPPADDPSRLPIAVGGVGGSGTRVVARILLDRGVDVGPDLNASLDNLWFTLLFVRPRWLSRALASDGEALGTGLGLFAAAMQGRLRPSPAEARYLGRATLDVARHGHNHLGDGRGRWAFRRARSLLSEGRRARGAQAWGWKEPATYLLLDPIRRNLGPIRYVHVVRHGLDMAFSRNQQHLAAFGGRYGIEPGDLGPEASLRYWLAANDRAVEEGRRLFGDGFVLVRYDDLCLDPRPTIERLLADLGEDPSPAELDRLAELPATPPSLGLHAGEGFARFGAEDVERVRAWGFEIGRPAKVARSGSRPRRRKRPLSLSVAMCTFNGARYLPQQLQSIAAQTRPPDELVVCDDGSTDATREILTEFSDGAFPVRLHEPEAAPLGPGRNFGRAIAACEGEVIALCDQDDVWAEDRLQRVEAAFTGTPGLALYFSDADLIDERSRSRGHRLWEALGITPGMWRRFSEGDSAERVRMLCDANLMTGATLALRASWRDLVLPIPDGWIHDAWIGLLLSATGDVRMSPERTIRYRLHPGQHTGIGVQAFTWAQQRLYQAQLVRRMTKRERMAFREIARGLTEARERLEERSDRHPAPPGVFTALSEKAAHFGARGHMDSAPHRWSVVRSELAAGRYHRYSNGWPSVAKDLLLLDRFGRNP